MKKVFYFIAALALALSACSKDDEVGSLKMTIEGTIYDAETSAPLAGATIKINTAGSTDSTTTDENGIFSLGNYATGEYIIKISKENYLTKTAYVASTSEIAVTENTETVVTNTSISLTPMNQSVNVTVYKNNQDASYDVKLAAANVPYTVYIDELNQYTGTTSSEGLISISNLPYDTYVYFIFDFVEDGITYAYTKSYLVGDDASYFTIYGSETTSSIGDFGLVSTNITNSYGDGIEDFNTTDAIVLSFTQAVDTTDFYFSLEKYNSTTVSLSYAWTNGNKTVTLTPNTTLLADTKYYIYFSVINESNDDSLYDSVTFYTAE